MAHRYREVRLIRRIILAALVAAIVVSGAAQAVAKPSLCARAYAARVHVTHRFGPAAAGRNICRHGIRTRVRQHTEAMTSWATRRPTVLERGRYLAQLRSLLRPAPPFLLASGVPSARPPAGVFRRSYYPTGLAHCIVFAESRFNPRATNGQYHGLAQWSPTIWARDGGLRYASDPIDASYTEQLLILSYGLEHHGGGSWTPYDGC